MSTVRSWVVVTVAAVVAIGLTGCSSGSSASSKATGPASSAPSTTARHATGMPVIIDTDLSRWWDDATTIGLANVLQQRGTLHVLGIGSDIRNPVAVAAIDAIDTAYGNASIPLGAVAHSAADTAPHGYSDALAAQLPHAIKSSADVPDAVSLYLRLLRAAPFRSVTIIALGAYTNIAGLLRADPKLVVAKVKRLVIMDGLFPGGGPAFTNQKLDLTAARAIVAGAPGRAPWPTPITWVDGLDGIATRVGASLCTAVAAKNPMRIVYTQLFHCRAPGDGDWDAPTLLYALGDSPAVFSELGRGGAAVINAKGGLSWQTPSTRYDDLYVHVVDQQALNARIDRLLATT
jgi:hypothetical protein